MKAWTRIAAGAIALALGASAAHAQSDGYSSVTDKRLEDPKPKNWLHWRGNYKGWGYSQLDQIDTDNVDELEPAWTLSSGVTWGHEAPPIVNDGMMYVTTSHSNLFALDAKTGEIVWQYKRQLPEDVVSCCDVVNRGVALYGDTVYMGTLDAHLLAFDAKSGKIKWDVTVADYTKRYTITSAPLVVDGKVITGVHGGEYGVRGFLAAYDAKSGKQVWKTHTTKNDGSWPGDSWKTGGASTWLTGTYDKKTDTVYWGTSNPSPWIDPARKQGEHDLHWSVSVLAIDPDDGEIKDAYQYSPNDSWDYDGTNEPMLISVENGDGEAEPSIVSPHRNGYFYRLSRGDNGKIDFEDAWPYAKTNVYKKITDEGRPVHDPEHRSQVGKTVDACPGFLGAKNWQPSAYHPDTDLVYVPGNEWCMKIRGAQVTYNAGEPFVGAEFEMRQVAGNDHVGELEAIDPKTGEAKWTQEFRAPLWGGVLTTGGDLVFTGNLDKREFMAFDAKSGEELWSFKTNSGVVGTPMTYEVDGTQYVAVWSGFGGAIPLWGGPVAKLTENIPMGGVLWVFELDQEDA
jgi:alcohol dehydrogenase (cytochrome c)